MRFLPILFSTPMIRAILDGEKSQTRRIKYKCEIGDILWVRETWREEGLNDKDAYIYKADFSEDWIKQKKLHWESPYYMKGYMARLFLKVKNVRIEKLQDITYEDILAEGIKPDKYCFQNIIIDFVKLWDSLNVERGCGWDNNPTVKVIEFEKVVMENPFTSEMNYENLNRVALMKRKVKKAKTLLAKFYKAEGVTNVALQGFLGYLEREFNLNLEATDFCQGEIGLIQRGELGETRMSVLPDDLFAALESGEKVDADWIWRNT